MHYGMPTNYGVRYATLPWALHLCFTAPMCNHCVTVETSMAYGAHSI